MAKKDMGKKQKSTRNNPNGPGSGNGSEKPISRRPDADRRIRQADRLARVMRVLEMIQSRGRWDLAAMADELDCSNRTIRRDLDVLEFAGVPYYRDEQNCYRVRSDFQFPTLMLTEEELLGLSLANTISRADGLNVRPGAEATTRKLASVSNEQVGRTLNDASRLVDAFDLKLADHSQHTRIVKTAQDALIQEKQLTGTYDSPYEAKPTRLLLHPYRLCLIKQAWYLIGRMEEESEPRTFRIIRFKSLRMLNEPAEIPRDFDPRCYFGNAWSVYRGSENFDVELEFDRDRTRIVTETNWHHTQHTRWHPDGRATLTFNVDGLEEILHWILSWSGHVTIRKPEKLRELYLKTLRSSLDRHIS